MIAAGGAEAVDGLSSTETRNTLPDRGRPGDRDHVQVRVTSFPQFAMFPLLDKPQAPCGACAACTGAISIRRPATVSRRSWAGSTTAPARTGAAFSGTRRGRSPRCSCARSISSARSPSPTAARCLHSCIAGIVGPRGDAYELNRTITADGGRGVPQRPDGDAGRAGVDLVSAMTFNTIAGGRRRGARGDARRACPCRCHSRSIATSRLASGPSVTRGDRDGRRADRR